MQTTTSLRRLTLALCLLALVAFSGCRDESASRTDPSSIRLGVLAAFNTPDGDGIRNGVAMAVEEINAAGGVAGRPLEVIAFNTEHSAEKAVAGYQRLAGLDHVDAVIGLSTSAAFGVLPMLESYRVPVLCTGAGADRLTELVAEAYPQHRYFFRVMHRSSELGEAVADYFANYLHAELGFKRFAIMVEDDIWTKSIRESWEQRIQESPGMELVYSGTFSSATADFVPLLSEILKADPDYILDATSAVNATAYIKQWAELEGPPLGAIPTGAGTRRYFEELGDRGRGVASIVTIPSAINALTPQAPAWRATYEANYGDPEYTSAYSYDAVYLFKAAVEKARTTEVDALIKALEEIRFGGVVGTWQFGKDHHSHFGPGFRRIPIIQYDQPGADGFRIIWPRELAKGDFVYPLWHDR
ncbi:MAG: ABC transporter substrate-binding protein [bacterium]|nr:ABC transporter substrate-binding protein [bacterium]